ncbi:MAG: endopeptidase La [Deltaproteobacteria bacterium HGW-Deltaproteobacteria-23]|nr:MAG: endopeptidase La [Deltaproteobacteria bacterium HGW-Deltaproteobacteria-23]
MPENTHIPETVPLFQLREIVAFPYMILTIFIKGWELPLFESTGNYNSLIALFKVKRDGGETVAESIHDVGTVCRVTKITRLEDETSKVTLEGASRVKLLEVVSESPFPLVRIEPVSEFFEKSIVSDALVSSLSALLKISLSYGRPLPDDVMKMINHIDNPGRLSDLVAIYLTLTLEEQQGILETIDPIERIKKVYTSLTSEVQRLQIKGEVQAEVSRRMGKTQKEYILREQMKQIKEELGDEEQADTDLQELKKRLAATAMPDEVRLIAEKELKRLERINTASPEFTVARTYLDYLSGMPWLISTLDNRDINQAEEVLNADHYNLKKVKERILEYLAVRTLKENMKGPILCFVGPPGVGKTSLGRSIAKALGRKFIRISLGGMRDEAEIRGHRRTYIGSMPGRIIQEIYRCGANNPVFMLDEVDKIGLDFRGDPASALLEVLDPEQNNTFTDHYMDVPFDLRGVMFITTANQLDPVPAALKDRMEILTLSGYTAEEKEHIANRYLIPREIDENGLSSNPPTFEQASLQLIISDYTREAGVRNLQRSIGSVCRKLAKEITQGKPLRTPINPELVEEFLGHRKFFNEVAAEQDRIGVVTGMAWTETGGDIIFVEATRMKGKGELILTGSLGDVMKESARAALSYIQANSDRLGIPADAFEETTIHIHVPAGSIPKDGPSAGITMATALVSLLTGRPARRDVSMTGEISLTGRVLAIGGLKEKVLAARRAGVTKLIIPDRNKNDLDDIPAEIHQALTFIFVKEIDQVLAEALQ